MQLATIIKQVKVVFPSLLAIAGIIVAARNQQPMSVIVIAGLIGASLGITVNFLVNGTLAYAGRSTPRAVPVTLRVRQLTSEKRIVLQSIKEIEFDVALKKLDPALGESLMAPLKQRALRILRELDEARVGHHHET